MSCRLATRPRFHSSKRGWRVSRPAVAALPRLAPNGRAELVAALDARGQLPPGKARRMADFRVPRPLSRLCTPGMG